MGIYILIACISAIAAIGVYVLVVNFITKNSIRKRCEAAVKEAEAEGNTAVAKYFDFANKVEEVHANLYKKALADPKGLAGTDYYVCKVCGYTHEGPCDSCPVCGGGAAGFFKVDGTCCLNK